MALDSSANYSGFLSALEDACEAAVPEAHANGIFISLLSLRAAAEADRLPCLLLDIDLDADEAQDWDEKGPVQVYYVMRNAADDVTTYSNLIAKLLLLQAELTNMSVSSSAGDGVQGKPSISASRRLPLNLAFEEAGQPFWCGRLTAQVWL